MPTACAVVEKKKKEWQDIGNTKGNLQAVGPLSLEAPTNKGTNCPTPSTFSKGNAPASYMEKIRKQRLKPGFQKIKNVEKLR